MATVSLAFTGLPDENPYPVQSGFVDRGAVLARIFGGEWLGSDSFWECSTDPATSQYSVYFTSGTAGSFSRGIAFFNSSGNGFLFIARNTDVRVFAMTAYALSGSPLATYAITLVANDVIRVDITQSTGTYVVKQNGTTRGTFVNTTYTSGLKSGFLSKGGQIRAFTLDYIPNQTVDSINGGNPITAGQTGIAIEATGFSAKPTAVTAIYASGAKSITATIDSGGTATNFNISIQDRIEAEDWPVNGDTLTFTLTYLTESATGTQTLVKKASETVLTVSGGITIDPATWTYWLTQDGFTVEGGEHDYIPYGDLVLTADGGGSATDAGTFTSWFRPATGTGAGNVYAYTWVITEAGISPAGSGLTSSGLTVSGLTIAGLTSPGL